MICFPYTVVVNMFSNAMWYIDVALDKFSYFYDSTNIPSLMVCGSFDRMVGG